MLKGCQAASARPWVLFKEGKVCSGGPARGSHTDKGCCCFLVACEPWGSGVPMQWGVWL